MGYKIRKYSNFKRRNIFDTYEPKKKVEFSREEALPFLFRVGTGFMALGGLMGFWTSSILIGLKGFLGIKQKVDRFSLNNRVVELRIKKY